MNSLPAERLVELDELLCQWQKLLFEVKAKEFFDYELFKTTFIKTFKFVLPLSHQKTIHKKYIELLSFAKEFEATSFIKINEEHSAACHLTHEMLQDCFVLFYPENKTPGMIDSKDVEHSYEDVDTLIHLIKNHL